MSRTSGTSDEKHNTTTGLEIELQPIEESFWTGFLRYLQQPISQDNPGVTIFTNLAQNINKVENALEEQFKTYARYLHKKELLTKDQYQTITSSKACHAILKSLEVCVMCSYLDKSQLLSSENKENNSSGNSKVIDKIKKELLEILVAHGEVVQAIELYLPQHRFDTRSVSGIIKNAFKENPIEWVDDIDNLVRHNRFAEDIWENEEYDTCRIEKDGEEFMIALCDHGKKSDKQHIAFIGKSSKGYRVLTIPHQEFRKGFRGRHRTEQKSGDQLKKDGNSLGNFFFLDIVEIQQGNKKRINEDFIKILFDSLKSITINGEKVLAYESFQQTVGKKMTELHNYIGICHLIPFESNTTSLVKAVKLYYNMPYIAKTDNKDEDRQALHLLRSANVESYNIGDPHGIVHHQTVKPIKHGRMIRDQSGYQFRPKGSLEILSDASKTIKTSSGKTFLARIDSEHLSFLMKSGLCQGAVDCNITATMVLYDAKKDKPEPQVLMSTTLENGALSYDYVQVSTQSDGESKDVTRTDPKFIVKQQKEYFQKLSENLGKEFKGLESNHRDPINVNLQCGKDLSKWINHLGNISVKRDDAGFTEDLNKVVAHLNKDTQKDLLKEFIDLTRKFNKVLRKEDLTKYHHHCKNAIDATIDSLLDVYYDNSEASVPTASVKAVEVSNPLGDIQSFKDGCCAVM